VRPIFSSSMVGSGQMPAATPGELADAVIDMIEAGVKVINLSVALVQSMSNGQNKLEEVLDYSARRGVIIVAAAGNQGMLGSSVITRHPWVIPVVSYNLQGKPMNESNLGTSIGRRGLGAPGDEITSLGAADKPHKFGGTSAATPFVTGAIGLIWSEVPAATAAEIKFAVIQGNPSPRTTVVPPLLDAWAAYQVLRHTHA
jgi:subtilisin family serine protease